MKSSRKFTLITALLSVTFILFGAILISGGTLELAVKPAKADSRYDTLANGSTYYYTDIGKVQNYCSSGTDAGDDVSYRTVNTSAVHGSATNPFVINTVAQWKTFAGDTANAQATGANAKYFILGSDLDFSVANSFAPIPNFGGYFYGNGKYLKNITYSFSNTANCGVFRVLQANALVADLNVDNIKFTDMIGRNGGIAGITYGGDILNCHVRGNFEGHNTSIYNDMSEDTDYYGFGGLVGCATGNTDVYIYRCSVFVKMTIISDSHGSSAGGILGSTQNNVSTYIFDCLAIVDVTSNSANDIWFGGIVNYTGYIGVQYLQNCVTYIKGTDNTVYRTAYGSLFNSWAFSVTALHIKNIYNASSLTVKNKGNFAMYPAVWWTSNRGTDAGRSSSNLNYSANSRPTLQTTVGDGVFDYFGYRAISATTYGTYYGKTQEDMWTALKADNTLSDDIWINKQIINDAYMSNTNVTTTSGYTIENSPVRNPLVVKIKYYNKTADGRQQIVTDPSLLTEGWHVVRPKGDLVDLDNYSYGGYSVAANHEFLGWTTDPEDISNPIKTAVGIYREVDLYAVWGVTGATLTPNVKATGTKLTDETGGVSFTFADGKLTLNAELTVDVMPNVVFEVQWKKNGVKIDGATDLTYTAIKEVKQSDVYSFDFIYYDSNEPLWRGDGSSENFKVTVKPAPLILDSDLFTLDKPAYSGRPYGTLGGAWSESDVVNPVPVVTNVGGTRINGTAEWTVPLGTVNDPETSVVNDGIETKKFTFTPDPSYNGNYGTSVEFDGVFEVERLTVTFKIQQMSSANVVADLEYGQDYTCYNIARLFDAAFKPYASDPIITSGGLTPAFVVAGESTPVKLSDYRKRTDIAYRGVNAPIEMQVVLTAATYTVTWNLDGGSYEGSSTIASLENQRYGQLILPLPNDPTRGTDMFLGWYYETLDEEGNTVELKWDFPNDRISDDLELFAVWLQANSFKGLTVTQLNTLVATDSIKDGDLKIVATFSGTAPTGETLERDVVLSWGDYTVTCAGADGYLHVATPSVHIEYTYTLSTGGATTFSDDFDINVTPKKVDFSKLNFKDKTVQYDGTPKNMNIPKNDLNGITGITGSPTYVYSLYGQVLSDGELPTETGVYTVTVTFNTYPDFKAEPLRATLTITAQATELTVKWDETTFMYNGRVQHPTPTFFDEEGNEVDLTGEYHFDGDFNVSAVKDNYSITVMLDRADYTIVGISGTTYFNIIKAVLETPKLKSDVFYNGNKIVLYDESNPEAGIFEGFNPDIMEIYVDPENPVTYLNAGTYRTTIILKDTQNCSWKDATGNTVTVVWELQKAHLTAVWSGYEHVKDDTGLPFYPKVSNFIGLADADKSSVDYVNDVIYSGDLDKISIGDYKVRAAINGSADWAKNYILDGDVVCSFVIVPREGMIIISVNWDAADFKYNGEVQRPTYTVTDKDGNPVAGDVLSELVFDAPFSITAGTYTATVKLKDENANYFIRGGTYEYTIAPNDKGETGNEPDDNNGGGFSLPENFPMWQVASTVIAWILLAIFAGMASGYSRKIKRLNREIDDYNTRTYAMLPIFSTIPVLFGLPNMAWSIIAFASIALMIMCFVIMLLRRKRYDNAELELMQAKRDDNKRRIQAELDDRMRRDDEMKMMFAGMMNMRGGNSAQDTAAIVNEVMTQLLPKITAMLPAASTAAATSDRNINIHVNGAPYESVAVSDDDDDDGDYESVNDDDEWDTVLDDDDGDDEAEYAEPDGTVKRMPSNFRHRLKLSSDKNRLWYTALKNMFCSQKGISYRVSGRVEKFKYQGQLIAVMGVAKRSMKLWLALDPNDYDINRYHQKDVSDKPRFIDVPMYVKVSSERALGHVRELVSALFEKLGTEARRRYADRDIQELIFTLKHNRLLTDKENKSLLCESIHVADCDRISDEFAERCLESKNIGRIGGGVFEELRLDDLDENFLDGQKVTIDALKKKGLVSEECAGYTVTAGSRLSKPLIVYADDFTLPAIKMIVLTGGRAIRLNQI